MKLHPLAACLAATAACLPTGASSADLSLHRAPAVAQAASSDDAQFQRRGNNSRQTANRSNRRAPQANNRNRGNGNKPAVRSNSRTNINQNNVNVNRNVNVNVRNDNHHGGWDDDWDDHWHPARAVATAAVTAAVVGSIVRSIPPSCSTVIVNGISYSQCGSTWYQPRYAGSSVEYIVVNPPR